MALNRKIAYIDLSTGKIDIKPIPLDVRKKFLGGRGLDAYLLYNHTKQGCDALGPDNTLMVSGGVLTATLASATARTHVMAKSPLGGMVGSCNMGGFFAPELAWAGFHHLVIKGKADKPVYLWVHNGKIEIRDARNVWGKTVTEAQWAIREELGDDDIKAAVPQILGLGMSLASITHDRNLLTLQIFVVCILVIIDLHLWLLSPVFEKKCRAYTP